MENVTGIDQKNPAAVLGQKGGKKRAENLSEEALRAIGRAGAEARWGNKAKANAGPKKAAAKKTIAKKKAADKKI
jgi:hypothetical protein